MNSIISYNVLRLVMRDNISHKSFISIYKNLQKCSEITATRVSVFCGCDNDK